MSKPKIAVLLAAYNGRSWLAKQVETILNQKSVEVKLFVSVDCSVDGTESWFDQLAMRDIRVVVLPHGQQFGGAAPNFFRLIREVNIKPFDFVSFADQDDIWHLNKLKRATEQIAIKGADAYSSNVVAFWPSGKEQLVCKSQPQQKWDFLFEAAGPGCTYVMRVGLVERVKECLRRNQERVQDVGLHDWFVYAFARGNGFKWVIDEYASMLYRQHSHNEVGANQGFRAHIYRAKRILNGWGLQQSLLIAKLVGLESNPFVLRWNNLRSRELVWLAFQARKCRRRRRDRLLFGISCLCLAMLGGSNR